MPSSGVGFRGGESELLQLFCLTDFSFLLNRTGTGKKETQQRCKLQYQIKTTMQAQTGSKRKEEGGG